ncbi:tRNA pseudouridine(38-40) synthase TruA [Clostridium aestuarii]|uniref:tRNA pseudouridine synthase A n=1 Tax=Clostridium aestuarii TaxID=338193 RepID=A0ABT4CWU0_9CLOT|nr:tRNA pseudouridine(38-40) synthase TruA [Clostridium aestuarii]MCY6483464.1 tRNA pseudouridine(38-40) synthase TruA [Clostridium aestuarii]
MKNIKIVIEYDGTNYAGWQIQKNAVTIQEKVEECIKKITGENITVTGCSRTDSGVHAKGFVGNFFTESSIPSVKFKDALNAKLPEDIVILDSQEVSHEFHSRYNSVGKEYVYTVLNKKERPVLNRRYVYHFYRQLNIDLMKQASKYFLGTHEFDSFRKKGSSVKTTKRTIYKLDIIKDQEYIKFIISGNGFLYNMVRIMVGTLLEVGIGKRNPEDIQKIILAKDRTKSGKPVPAIGLCLVDVFY